MRKLFISLLAFTASATMWADGNVAKIGETEYATLQAAVNAATEGQTIVLIDDINEAVENTNINSFTIDLNGKNWTSDATATFKNNGSVVTFEDNKSNGSIRNSANANDQGIAVWARTGSVIINSGKFISTSNYEATLYVGTSAANLNDKTPTITVNDGTFKNTATGAYSYNANLLPLTLNVYNEIVTADTYKAIVINGGIFYGNDPSKGDDSQLGNSGMMNGNFCNAGYIAEASTSGDAYQVLLGARLNAYGYATYCAAVDWKCENQDIRVCAGHIAGNDLELNVVETGTVIKAGEGVMLMANATLLANQTIYFEAAANGAKLEYNEFKGTLEPTPVASMPWAYGLYNDMFHHLTSGSMPQGRAYLNPGYDPLDGSHAAMRIVIRPTNPMVTGVEEATAAKATKALVNGKLVIVRGAKTFDVNGKMLK